MAKTLDEQKKVFSLKSIIKSNVDEFIVQRKKLQDIKIAQFNRRVIDEGLTAEDQVSFYRNLLKKERKKAVSDHDFIKEIEGNISSFQKLDRAEKFAEDFRQSFNELVGGMRSLDEHIKFLNGQLDSVISSDLKQQINEKLTEAFTQRQTSNKTILNNQIQFALNDKTEQELTNMIKKVKSKIAKVDVVGDEEYVTSLGISLQSLQKQLQESRLQRTIIDTQIEVLNDPNPINKINSFNKQFAVSDSITPITVNGVNFESVRAFWEFQKAEYLGSGDFFEDIDKFYTERINAAQVRSQETLPISLKNLKGTLDQLLTKPDFREHQEQLQNTISLIVGYGANIVGQNIVKKAKTNYDFQTAANNISNISKWSGTDLTQHYQDLVSSISDLNLAQATAINEVAASFKNDNPGASYAEAFDFAIKQTPNVIVSPEKLATTPPGELAEEQVEEEIKDVSIQKPGAQIPTSIFTEGGFFKTKASPTVFKIEGGKARPIVGNFSEEVFKAQLGKTFADVIEVENFEGIETGENIAKQQATLFDPTGKSEPVIVDVGSQQASDLQGQGFVLEKPEENK